MISSFFKRLDFIGVTPRIFYKGDFRFKTSTGGGLSLGLSLFMLIISLYFISIFFSRNSFTLYENTVTISRAKKMYSRQDFSITVLDKYFQKIENSSKIYSIYADIWTDKRYYEDGILKPKTQIFPISFENCNISSYEKYHLWKDEKLINESICFSEESIKDNINSTGVFGETGYTGIVFWISICSNSSLKNDCYPFEKSKEILDNIFIYIKVLDVYFNHNNLHNNAIPYIRSDLIQASSSVYKRQWYLFQEVEYISDEGILFYKYNKKKLTTFSSTYNSIDERINPTINNSFFVLSLNMDGTKKIINRKYYKIQDLFSDINGLFQMGYNFIFCLNFIYCYNRMNEKIINSNICNYLEHNQSNVISKKYCLNVSNSISLNNKLNNSNEQVSSLINKTPKLNYRRINSSFKNFLSVNNEKQMILKQKSLQLNNFTNSKSLKIQKLENKKFKIHLSFFQSFNLHLILCPKNLIFHHNAIIRNFSIIEEIILNQFDVINLLNKINLMDKFELSFFSDENRKSFYNCYNPQIKFIAKRHINENITFKIKKENEIDILKKIVNQEILNKLNE